VISIVPSDVIVVGEEKTNVVPLGASSCDA
jgi:hypothetical protein